MSAFDDAWSLLKMGRIFRGGEDPYGSYWTHLPMMANSFALGGQQMHSGIPDGSLFEIDDPKIDEAAIKDLFRRFRTEEGGYLGGYDRGRGSFEYVKTPRFESIPDETFHPDEVDSLEDEFAEAERGYGDSDVLHGLAPETLDWLKTGNVGAFYYTPDTSGYKSQFDFLADAMSGRKRPDLPPLSEAGASGRQPLIDRLIATRAFENPDEIPQILQRYISSQQNVGDSWTNTREENEALERGLQQAGIDWLAYIDKDPRGAPSLLSLNNRNEELKARTIANYKENAEKAGVNLRDIFECSECGEIKSDINAYDSSESVCGECEGALWCAGCIERWEDCRCGEEDEEEDWEDEEEEDW